MAAYLWIEGVPGRAGWDGWFGVDSFNFGGQGFGGGGVGGGAATGRTSFNTANASKRTDASSPAIMQRCARGDVGPASLWVSDKNDVPLYQYDMTDVIVTGFSHSTSGHEQFSLSFAKYTWSRATN